MQRNTVFQLVCFMQPYANSSRVVLDVVIKPTRCDNQYLAAGATHSSVQCCAVSCAVPFILSSYALACLGATTTECSWEGSYLQMTL